MRRARPVVAGFDWRGSAAADAAPLLALCGKGVCFDSGGYDIKPADGMLRMKKDMGGAAVVLGLARVLMQADLPIRLMLRIGCVENSISGAAMRPLDVIRTRRGIAVEVGNTDAEGRLVLADLLAEASEARPALLVDCATLTGAARAALGPDLPAMFATDDAWAERLAAAAAAVHDPLWRLPLWDGYESWLDSNVADLNNVSTQAVCRRDRCCAVPAPLRRVREYRGCISTSTRGTMQPGRDVRKAGKRRRCGRFVTRCDMPASLWQATGTRR